MILTDKRILRKSIRAEIVKLSHKEREALSSQIFCKIAELKEVKKASVIALFISLADEPQTADFIAKISHSKRVVIPRIEGEEMNFYDISEGLQCGTFGIMEPIATTPIP